MESSGPIWTPCARGYWPSPQDRRKLPSRSNTMTGCSPRLKTYTLSLASTPTAPTSLNDHPSGSFAQFSMMRYLKSPAPTMTAISSPPPTCLRVTLSKRPPLNNPSRKLLRAVPTEFSAGLACDSLGYRRGGMSQYGYSDFYKRVWGHDGSDAHFEVMAKYFADKLQPLLPSDLSAVILEIGCGIGFAI